MDTIQNETQQKELDEIVATLKTVWPMATEADKAFVAGFVHGMHYKQEPKSA